MNVRDIVILYDYNYWATGEVLTACAHVTPEEFRAPRSRARGGLRFTLTHILDAEHGWRILCQRHTLDFDLVESDFPELRDLRTRWDDEESEMRRFLAGLRDEDLEKLVRYTTDTGEARARVLWHCLIHVVNHGTHHRSQAAAILRELGRPPGDLDLTRFLLERK